MKKFKISKLSKYLQKNIDKKFIFIEHLYLLDQTILMKLSKNYWFVIYECDLHICELNIKPFKNSIIFKGELKDVEGLIETGFMERLDINKNIQSDVNSLVLNNNFPHLYNLKKQVLWFAGKVLQGEKVARTLGTNTANLYCENKFIIKDGVYYTKVIFKRKFYDGLTCIRTDKDGIDVVETHILNFKKDIYGKKIKITFISKIRDNKKPNSIEDVKSWIKQDLIDVKKEVEKYEGENWMPR